MQLASFQGDLPPAVPHHTHNGQHQTNPHLTELTEPAQVGDARVNVSGWRRQIHMVLHPLTKGIWQNKGMWECWVYLDDPGGLAVATNQLLATYTSAGLVD